MEINNIPITERSNPKSMNIDMLGAADIIRVLSDCEHEIFGGYNGSQGVYERQFIEKCVLFASKIQQEILNNGKVNILLVGAGTSGRLCRLMAKILTPIVGKQISLTPIIAGGIKALVRAEPNTEDKIEKGVADFLAYSADMNRSTCFVIGVSCGLSANYVKGALEEANKYSKGQTAIIGFNPVEMATVELGENIQVLNPIIGPEPIVGSVRMKGGTTTMMLIYALVVASLMPVQQIKDMLINIFKNCEDALAKVGNYQSVIEKLINSGNTALRKGGSIYLLGSSSYGALCIYDAAECPPTFGASIKQVNGYSQKGVTDLVYFPFETGEVMAKEIDVNDFVKNTLPSLTEKDMVVIFFNREESSEEIRTIIKSKLNNLFSVQVAQKSEGLNNSTENSTAIFEEDWKNDFLKILFVRSLLVYISTGSFVLSGKVFENKMIDLRITNKKLFLRAIRIINSITHKDEEVIKKVLLRSIYEKDVPSSDSLEDHISLSAGKEHIVPLSIISLVYPEKNLGEIKMMLSQEPIVRKLIITELANLR